MAHFAGDYNQREQIYFAISTNVLHWKDLTDGETNSSYDNANWADAIIYATK